MTDQTQRVRRFLFLLALLGLASFSSGTAQVARTTTTLDRLAALADVQGGVRVIVELDTPFVPEPLLATPQAVTAQRSAIDSAQSSVLSRVAVAGGSVRRLESVPMMALDVDRQSLATLASSPGVRSIQQDTLDRPTLAQSTAQVGATTAWTNGATGTGWAIAVLDTGVDKAHPFLEGKVLSEACFSTTSPSTGAASVCPGGVSQSTAPGSGVPCANQDCFHGTHVAGIAAGEGTSFSGVARSASLIAVQVFSEITNSAVCGNASPCAAAFVSDQIAALERVYALRGAINIAAVNMSLGGDLSSSICDGDARKPIIDTLRAAGILTVVSSGNNGSSTRITAPACISSTLSVGSVGDGSSGQRLDVVSSFSNSAPFLDMLAPGASITSSRPGGTFTSLNGTSMAAPHVAGALAVLRQQAPSLSADQLEGRLLSTGLPLTDNRNSLVRPRLRVDAALAQGCSFTVSPLSIAVPYVASVRTVTVTAPAGCWWTASSPVPWAPIASGASGAGTGTVAIDVRQNTLNVQRSATLTVAGQSVLVQQAASPCTFQVQPVSTTIGAAGGIVPVTVTASAADCAWSVTAPASFLTPSGTQGTGSAIFNVTVAANPLSASRSGSLTVAGQPVTVVQDGVVCAFTLSTTTVSVSAAGATRTVTVTANASDCSWSASSPVPWVTVTKTTSGTSASVSVQANTSAQSRSTSITIAGRSVTVTQSGVTCSYTFSPAAPSIGAAGGVIPVTVTANAPDCSWTPSASASWLQVPSTARVGSGVLSISVDGHTRVTPRSATVSVGSSRVTVTQAGLPCSFTLTATPTSFGSAGGTGQLAIAPNVADCGWTATSNADWLTIVGSGSGAGSGTVSFAVAATNFSTVRSARVTVGAATATITQAGMACDVRLTTTETSVGASGGPVAVAVSANASDCRWSVATAETWLMPASVEGVGSAAATFTAGANPLSAARVGTLTLGSQTVSVRQAGVVCSYKADPSALSFTAAGGGRPLTLSANAPDCAWTASQVPVWVQLSQTAGVGSHGLTVTAVPHAFATPRRETLIVGGVSIPIDQSGVACTYALSSNTVEIGAAGGTSSVQVRMSAADCGVPTSSSAPWLAVGVDGTVGDTRAVRLTAQPNLLAASRRGDVVVGGQPLSVVQAGVACTFQLSAGSLSTSAAGGVVRVLIAAAAPDCAWSVVGATSWAVPGALNGVGSQGLDFSVAPNTDEVPRATTFVIAGTPLIINQGSRNVGASLDGDNDTLPDAWESRYGLSPAAAAGPDGPNGDPDGDGVTNLDEFVRSSHPKGTSTKYLAEGATGSFFSTRIALANPTSSRANVLLRFIRNDSVPTVHYVSLPAMERRTVVAADIQGLASAEFSTIVESDVPIAVDRLMSWDANGYGTHLESAVTAPASSWYLAEGATTDPFELFYLLENPNASASRARVRFLASTGEVIERFYDVPAGTRVTVWVDRADPRLAAAELSGIIDVVSGAPIIVERAMYLSRPGSFFAAGHESAGVQAPAERWYLAEGATGAYFDTFLLVLNPTSSPAQIQVDYLLPSGAPVVKSYVVGPQRRATIWVDTQDARLADSGFGAVVQSTNGVPVVVERSMWWPGGNWQEAHGARASQYTSRRWVLAEGETGGAFAAQTFVLISNVSTVSATINVTLLFENGPAVTRSLSLGAMSRYALNVPDLFPEAPGKRYSTLVESVGAGGAQLVVEQAIYSTPQGGTPWGAGAAASGTPLP